MAVQYFGAPGPIIGGDYLVPYTLTVTLGGVEQVLQGALTQSTPVTPLPPGTSWDISMPNPGNVCDPSIDFDCRFDIWTINWPCASDADCPASPPATCVRQQCLPKAQNSVRLVSGPGAHPGRAGRGGAGRGGAGQGGAGKGGAGA